MSVSASVPINSMAQGWRCQCWGAMKSLTLSLFPSYTHSQLKQTLPDCPDVAEVGYRWGWGRGKQRKKGVEVEYKASSRASNSTLTDLLPIR